MGYRSGILVENRLINKNLAQSNLILFSLILIEEWTFSYGSKYSRMDRVEFVEENLSSDMVYFQILKDSLPQTSPFREFICLNYPNLDVDLDANPFHLNVTFHIENSLLFCEPKQMTGFCMKCITGLKWANKCFKIEIF